MKKTLCIFLTLAMLIGCGMPRANADAKPVILASLFPQYDFVRQIAGDRVELKLLLPPGAESHSYEPTPRDMLEIQKADLLVATGPDMEPWVWRLVDGLGSDVPVVDASVGIALEPEGHEHGHEEPAHQHGYDSHVWLDPTLAAVMVDNIAAALCEVDPDARGEYLENANAYKHRLLDLDARFMDAAESGARKKIVFGGRFAFGYFVRRYGLEYISAYDSCASDSEPSVQRMKELLETIEFDGIPVVYYEELSDPKIGRTLCEQTGAKLLLMHSAHNVTPEQLEQGITYLDIMEQNLENLREGLN